MPSVKVNVDKAEVYPELRLYLPDARDKFPYWRELEVSDEFMAEYAAALDEWARVQLAIRQKLLENGVHRDEFY